MQSLRQIGAGVLLGVVSIAIVIGGFALSMAEGGFSPQTAPLPTDTFAPLTSLPTLPILLATDTFPANSNPQLPTDTIQPAAPTTTATLPPPPTGCLPPANWIAVSVQPYETLDSLAAMYGTSTDALSQANCLVSAQLVAGSVLYVPARPTSTPVPCGAPPDWIIYYVQPGDTLYHISLLYGVTVQQLQQANCLGYSTFIKSGQPLRVPNVPTSTPWLTATWTAIPAATATPSATTTSQPTPSLPPATTQVPSSTPQPPTATANAPTSTSTIAPTNTPIPATATTAPSATPQPSTTPTTKASS